MVTPQQLDAAWRIAVEREINAMLEREPPGESSPDGAERVREMLPDGWRYLPVVTAGGSPVIFIVRCQVVDQ